MRNLENRVTLLIWLAFAADYLGWLDPIVAVLDGSASPPEIAASPSGRC